MIIQRDCPNCGRKKILESQKLYKDSNEKNAISTMFGGVLGFCGLLAVGPLGLGAATFGKNLSDKFVESFSDEMPQGQVNDI